MRATTHQFPYTSNGKLLDGLTDENCLAILNGGLLLVTC